MIKMLRLASVAAVAAMIAVPAAEAAQKVAPGGSTFTFNNGSGARPHIGGGGGGGNYAHRPNPGNPFPGGGQQHSYNNWKGGDHDGRHHRRHRGFAFYGAPFYSNYYYDDYAYSYSGDDDCRYYWRKYQRTGNPVWKRRYYQCID